MHSTIMLESLIFNIPNIILAADVERLAQPHVKRVIETQGVSVAKNINQLKDHIDKYLTNPSLDNIGRKMIFENELGPNRGTAGKEIGNYLIRMVL